MLNNSSSNNEDQIILKKMALIILPEKIPEIIPEIILPEIIPEMIPEIIPEIPEEGIGKTGPIIGRTTMLNNNNNNNEDKIILKTMRENFAKVIGFVAFMLPILIVPKYFLALGIFAAFMKSFGVPLTPLVLGGIFYEIITALDPILLTLLGVWTILKVFILRRPLVDINYWKHRMNARCCYSRRSN